MSEASKVLKTRGRHLSAPARIVLHSEDDGTRTRNHRIDSPERPILEHYEKQHDTPLADSGCTAGCTRCEDKPKGGRPDGLTRVVEAWPTLPEPLRRAMLAMVDATG